MTNKMRGGHVARPPARKHPPSIVFEGFCRARRGSPSSGTMQKTSSYMVMRDGGCQSEAERGEVTFDPVLNTRHASIAIRKMVVIAPQSAITNLGLLEPPNLGGSRPQPRGIESQSAEQLRNTHQITRSLPLGKSLGAVTTQSMRTLASLRS